MTDTDGNRLAPDRILTVSEVAELFKVDPKTVTRWAKDGKLPEAFSTLGGHRRWRESDVRPHLQPAARS